MVRALLGVVATVALSVHCTGPERDPDPSQSEADDDTRTDVPDDDILAEPARTPFGLIVVDVQNTFIAGAVNPDIDLVIARIGDVLSLAGAHAIPTFVTFEASDTGSHQLAPSLVPLLPAHSERFIKTTFDANGLRSFAAALADSALTHFVVVGSETDVCVMQTVLGLRRAGYGVLLQQDAVFSSEPNTGPALRRMVQSGVSLIDTAAVTELIVHGSHWPAPPSMEIPRTTPGEVGILLHHLTDDDVSDAVDPWTSAKLARLRELLFISEWFAMPLFATDPDLALPVALQGLLSTTIQPASAIDDAIKQLVIAGSDADLGTLVDVHHGARTLFLLEDALIAKDDAASLRSFLEDRYAEGDIPLTYKSLYYEMTETVAFEDWPADWIERDAVYYDLTVAPESLPPITP